MKQKILLIASGIFGLAMASQAALVAHYTFDDATPTDSSGNGYHASIVGSVVPGHTGIAGNAYQFSAGNYVQATAAGLLADLASDQLTFSAWIQTADANATGSPAPANRVGVVGIGNGGTNNRYTDLGILTSTAAGEGTATGDVYARHRATGNGQNAYSNGANLEDGNWHHLVLTLDLAAASGQLKLYVDGVQQTAYNPDLTGGNLAQVDPVTLLRIGALANNSAGGDPFSGLIDDVQIYNNALSGSEVAWLYANAGQAIPEPSALGLAGLGFLALLRRKRA